MSPEDVKTTKENHQLLALTEHPQWGVFVQIVEHDLQQLDTISSLMIEANREDLMREIEVRFHTIEKLRSYINNTILRAESALQEQHDQKNDIINIRE